jgi:hypothetical protein
VAGLAALARDLALLFRAHRREAALGRPAFHGRHFPVTPISSLEQLVFATPFARSGFRELMQINQNQGPMEADPGAR